MSERERVLESGGALFNTGNEYRVYPANLPFAEARALNLSINMTRALGHIKLGLHGISSIPHIHSMQLPQSDVDTVIVLGSDGLFDVVAQDLIKDVACQKGKLEETVRELLVLGDRSWQQKKFNDGRKYGDNVTAIVARCTTQPTNDNK